MIAWLAVGGAILVAVAVLGFCSYEVLWRQRRLQRDLTQLAELAPEVAALQRRLQLLQHRASPRSAEHG